MQHRKLHFGFLPAAVSNKECADTAMAMIFDKRNQPEWKENVDFKSIFTLD